MSCVLSERHVPKETVEGVQTPDDPLWAQKRFPPGPMLYGQFRLNPIPDRALFHYPQRSQ